MDETRNFHGHVYRKSYACECPIKGCEDGQLATRDRDGNLAYWEKGWMYTLDKNASKTTKSTMGWISDARIATARKVTVR